MLDDEYDGSSDILYGDTVFRKILTATTIAFAIFVGVSSANAASVNLKIDTNGKLTGASNVNISGVFYDVQFVDNSACHVFGACSPYAQGIRDFWDAASAGTAAQALLDQVFIDSPLGAFDSNPNLTFGIDDPTVGYVAIPWSSVWTDCQSQSCMKVAVAWAANSSNANSDLVSVENSGRYWVDPLVWNNTSGDIIGGSPSPWGVFADFSLAAPPLPRPFPNRRA